uniref:G domain-containing protein n=1 Tax=Arcella intermedia TaxID=1963864 RepID=A0A6B2LAR7_9EUKA
MGAPGSGCTTLFKAFQIIYSGWGEDAQRQEYRPLVEQHFWRCVEDLARLVETSPEIGASEREAISPPPSPGPITKEAVDWAEQTWHSDAVCRAVSWTPDGHSGTISSYPYTFPCAERLLNQSYTPTLQDILFTSTRLTGILTEDFTWDGYKYTVIDVGGQKSERRKWIDHFDDASLLYVVNMLCVFDPDELEESLKVFESFVGNERLFGGVVLMMNKVDLFERVCVGGSFRSYGHLGDYGGEEKDLEGIKRYVAEKFLKVLKERNVVIHYTTATDLDMMSHILKHILQYHSAPVLV